MDAQIYAGVVTIILATFGWPFHFKSSKSQHHIESDTLRPENRYMKQFLFIFLLTGCSSMQEKANEEVMIRQELTEMTAMLENMTYAIHKPIYRNPDD